MTLDRVDQIQARKDKRELLRERSESLIAHSLIVRQYSRELIQAIRLLRLKWRED